MADPAGRNADVHDVAEDALGRMGVLRARLDDFVAIPSVSGDNGDPDEVRRAATWLGDTMTAAGWDDVHLLCGDGAPVVTGLLSAPDPDAPTVVLYGHYDVQPVGDPDLWDTPAFEVVERDGRLFGRGTADDKGPILVHLAALEAWTGAGGPPVHVRALFEGEEESGSETLPQLLAKHDDLLACDAVVVSDTSMVSEQQPSLCIGLRGMAALRVAVTTADSELHSGKFGGIVRNAAVELGRLLGSLHDDDGRIQVAGFLDDVRPVDPDERDRMAALAFDVDGWIADVGATQHGDPDFAPLERAWLRPTIEVSGVQAGHAGPGVKTIVPEVATAVLTCRLVPDQQPDDIAALVAAHLGERAPDGVDVDVTFDHGGDPWSMDPDSPIGLAALAAYRFGYQTEPAINREGGSVPIVAGLHEALAPVVLFGFGLPDQMEHAPNERLVISNVRKAVRASVGLWPELARRAPDVRSDLGSRTAEAVGSVAVDATATSEETLP